MNSLNGAAFTLHGLVNMGGNYRDELGTTIQLPDEFATVDFRLRICYHISDSAVMNSASD